jgi:hypothetical protein
MCKKTGLLSGVKHFLGGACLFGRMWKQRGQLDVVIPTSAWRTRCKETDVELSKVSSLQLPFQHLTYSLTSWCRVLLEKLTGLQLVKEFTAFHGTRRFVTALTNVRHPSLSWASPIQSIYPHPTFWRSIPILSTHLRLGLPSGLFPSGFPARLSSPIRATCPVHLILLDFITHTILGEEYKSFNSSLYSLLHSPGTSSLLGPNILLISIFSNTLSFLSSSNVSDQVSHPYKTTGKIIVLYILIFKFFG